jgi:hypothetical protein
LERLAWVMDSSMSKTLLRKALSNTSRKFTCALKAYTMANCSNADQPCFFA